MTTITRCLEFDAGHRVLGHEGKCRHLHGHRYVAEITVRAPELDSLGRVIDFGEIKRLIGGWIDANWDHNLILHPQDPLLKALVQLDDINLARPDPFLKVVGSAKITGGRQIFVMPSQLGNPTAENLAAHLAEEANVLLPSELKVVNVRLYETPNSFADYSPGKNPL